MQFYKLCHNSRHPFYAHFDGNTINEIFIEYSWCDARKYTIPFHPKPISWLFVSFILLKSLTHNTRKKTTTMALWNIHYTLIGIITEVDVWKGTEKHVYPIYRFMKHIRRSQNAYNAYYFHQFNWQLYEIIFRLSRIHCKRIDWRRWIIASIKLTVTIILFDVLYLYSYRNVDITQQYNSKAHKARVTRKYKWTQ